MSERQSDELQLVSQHGAATAGGGFAAGVAARLLWTLNFVEPIETLLASWAEGDLGWGPVRSEHQVASEAELNDFETKFRVVLPTVTRSFYQQLNGMTEGEWHRDLNHANVKFMPLKSLFTIAPPFVMPNEFLNSGEKFIAIAAEFDSYSSTGNSCLVYGVRLSETVELPGEVFGFSEDVSPFFISPTYSDFLRKCAEHRMWDEDGVLNPPWGNALKDVRQKYAIKKSMGSQKVWWKFWA